MSTGMTDQQKLGPLARRIAARQPKEPPKPEWLRRGTAKDLSGAAR